MTEDEHDQAYIYDKRPFVCFNLDGSIRFHGVQPVGFTNEEIEAEGLYVVGDAGFDRGTCQYTNWVDWVDGAWKVVPRPEMDAAFDRLQIPVMTEATAKNVPASTVSFEGPVSGSLEHPGGDLSVGWAVPGTYVLTIKAFPQMPAAFTFTVEP